jgi:hypothetical protein
MLQPIIKVMRDFTDADEKLVIVIIHPGQPEKPLDLRHLDEQLEDWLTAP